MAISFAAVLDVLPASDCPRYTQKYLFPSNVSANPVNHASTTIPSALLASG